MTSPLRSLALILAGVCLLSPAALAAPRPLSDDEAARIASALRAAPDQGFEPGAFGEDKGLALLASSDQRLKAEGREQLAEAVVAYAAAQHGQRLAPAQFPKDWAIRPPPYDAHADFEQALAENRLATWIAALPPADPDYQRLLATYRHYRDLAAGAAWPTVPGKAKPGDSGPTVAALRGRLAMEDPNAGVGPDYDDSLKAAVARAQTRLGLDPDGVAGPATVAALNIGAEARLQQIAANLERRRWMPRALPPARAEVNIADASLVFFEPGQTPLAMRAVVGEPKKQTPMFTDRIKAVVLNPPWNVPEDIARSEILPKMRKDPGYAAREGFVIKANGEVQQLPGPKCALGAIKFDLDNPFGVYLHDTPAKSLFGQPKRDLSHGCMRLEQPNLLAKRLLLDNPQWPADSIDAAILTGKTLRIPVKDPPALYVVYWTALAAADGGVTFRADAYGWDRQLTELLKASPKR